MANRTFRAPRKTKSWSFIQGSEHILTGNTTQFGAGFSTGDTRTVMRILGEYTVSPSSAPVSQDAVEIGVGIAVVSSDAFTVGATAAPDPIGDEGYPWLYWAAHKLFFTTSTNDPSQLAGSHRQRTPQGFEQS